MRRHRTAPRSRRPTPAASVRTVGFVGGVLGTAFAVALGFGLIVPALPAFATRLGASYSATSAIVATFAAVRLLSSPPAGVLVDRVGARVVVAAGTTVVAVSSAAIALVTSYVQLLVLRGVGGVGSALFITGIGQHVVRTIPSAERGRANGMLQGAFLMGGASGPALGGLVVDALGIRAPFAIYAVTLLVAAVVTLRYLRSDPDPAPAGGAPVRGRGVRSALQPISGNPDVQPEPGPGRIPSVAEGQAGGLPGDPPVASARLGPLWGDRTFQAVLLLYGAVAWASQGIRLVAIPLLGTEVLGESLALVGVALTASSAAHGLLLWPVGQFADGRGRLLPARVGTAVYVVSMLGLVTVDGPVSLVLWLVVQGAANGIVSPIPAAVVADLVPPQAAGRAVAVLNVARDVGTVLGPLVTGILAQAAGFDAAFLLAAALLAAAFAVSLTMRETLQRPR